MLKWLLNEVLIGSALHLLLLVLDFGHLVAFGVDRRGSSVRRFPLLGMLEILLWTTHVLLHRKELLLLVVWLLLHVHAPGTARTTRTALIEVLWGLDVNNSFLHKWLRLHELGALHLLVLQLLRVKICVLLGEGLLLHWDLCLPSLRILMPQNSDLDQSDYKYEV